MRIKILFTSLIIFQFTFYPVIYAQPDIPKQNTAIYTEGDLLVKLKTLFAIKLLQDYTFLNKEKQQIVTLDELLRSKEDSFYMLPTERSKSEIAIEVKIKSEFNEKGPKLKIALRALDRSLTKSYGITSLDLDISKDAHKSISLINNTIDKFSTDVSNKIRSPHKAYLKDIFYYAAQAAYVVGISVFLIGAISLAFARAEFASANSNISIGARAMGKGASYSYYTNSSYSIRAMGIAIIIIAGISYGLYLLLEKKLEEENKLY